MIQVGHCDRDGRTRGALRTGSLALALVSLFACASGGDKSAEEQASGAARVPESERKAWDAEEMTRLTADLSRAVRDVRNAWRKDPAFADSQNPNRRAAMRLDQTLRDLDRRTTQLASRVKDGGGYDETFNIARNIGVLLNDVDMEGRRIASSQFMEARVRPAMALINEIAPYYGRGPLYDADSMQKTDRPARTR